VQRRRETRFRQSRWVHLSDVGVALDLLLDPLPHWHERTDELGDPKEERRVIRRTGARRRSLWRDGCTSESAPVGLHGTTVETQGTLYCSHVVATGIVVSGAELTNTRSTPELINSW